MNNSEKKYLNAEFKTEILTGRVLRFGVWISATLIASGLFVAALRPSSIITISSNPSLIDLLARIFSGKFDPVTLMFTGLVLLMLTPVLRVITAIIGFASQRNWKFVLVSSIVFLLLVGEIIYSIFLKG